MRCYCISSDVDVLTGMRLAGIGGELVSERRAMDAALDRVCADADIAILVVTEECYAMCRERIDTLRLSAGRPLVNIIASSRGGGRAPDSITRLINEAIGVKIDAKS